MGFVPQLKESWMRENQIRPLNWFAQKFRMVLLFGFFAFYGHIFRYIVSAFQYIFKLILLSHYSHKWNMIVRFHTEITNSLSQAAFSSRFLFSFCSRTSEKMYYMFCVLCEDEEAKLIGLCGLQLMSNQNKAPNGQSLFREMKTSTSNWCYCLTAMALKQCL